MSEPTTAGVPVCYRHPGRETYIGCQRCGRPICPDCMVPASVGFQCPDCVRQGSRETRQPRARLGGLGGRGSFAQAPATYTIIGINILVFIVVNVVHGAVRDDLMLHARSICEVPGGYYAGLTRPECVAMGGGYSPGVREGGYWELVTSIFTHQAVWHVGANMLSLWMLGVQLEGFLGLRRYLALYALSGLAGSALVYWLAAPQTPTLGASGAIFGLFAAYAVIVVRMHGSLQSLLFPLILNFGITFAVPGIAWQAHVGGFVAGLVVMGLFVLTPGVRRRRWQWAGLAAVALVIVLMVVTRSLDLNSYTGS